MGGYGVREEATFHWLAWTQLSTTTATGGSSSKTRVLLYIV